MTSWGNVGTGQGYDIMGKCRYREGYDIMGKCRYRGRL